MDLYSETNLRYYERLKNAGIPIAMLFTRISIDKVVHPTIRFVTPCLKWIGRVFPRSMERRYLLDWIQIFFRWVTQKIRAAF